MRTVKYVRTTYGHYYNADKKWVDKNGDHHYCGDIIETDTAFEVYEDEGMIEVSKTQVAEVAYAE